MRKKLFLLILFIVVTGSNMLFAQTAKYFFFTFYTPDPLKAVNVSSQQNDLIQRHAEYIRNLSDNKITYAAGKLDNGGYILITRNPSAEQAKEIAEADPLANSGNYTVETFPLMLGHNWICPPEKPIRQVQYQLVRFVFNMDYFGDLDIMARENRIFMAELNRKNDFVKLQGNFNNYNEGVLILDVPTKEQAEKIIKKHPAVKAEQILYEIRTLTVANGTFCKP